MKLYISIALWGYVLSTTFISCNSNTERSVVRLDLETLDYFDFKKGDEWVYEEQNTHAVDTCCIYLRQINVYSIPDLYSYDFEKLQMFTYWSSSNKAKNGPDRDVFISLEAERIYKTGVENTLVEEQVPWYNFPNFIFASTLEPGTSTSVYSSDTITYTQFHDSIAVGDSIYYDVMELTVSQPVHNKRIKTSFWSKHIGRIKFETFDGEIWHLTEHNIKP